MTISNEAVEAAKKAMQEVTPPPGMTTAEWIDRYGEYAWIAGAIAAAAPIIRADALLEAADEFAPSVARSVLIEKPEAIYDAIVNRGSDWLRARAAAVRGEG